MCDHRLQMFATELNRRIRIKSVHNPCNLWLNCLCNLQTITARVANVEARPAGCWHVVRNNLDTRTAKSLLSFSKVTDRITHVSLTDAILAGGSSIERWSCIWPS